jgi:hypothetical protein
MEIRIGKSTRACAATQKPFEHGEELLSLVRQSEEGLIREDFAKAEWNPAHGEGAIAVWATNFVDPDRQDEFAQEAHSPLRNLFYEAVEQDDRPSLAKAYLAAQLLRRQRVFRLLKEGEEADGDARFALFTDRIGDRIIEVRDPNLSYAELNAARAELMEHLNALESPTEENGAEEGESETQETESEIKAAAANE